MKQTLSILLLSLIITPCFAQLTLERCHELARAQYPLIKQYDLIQQSQTYTLSNAVKAFLPEVKFSFGANGFTDPIKQTPQMDAMGMGDMKNYLLNGSLQVNQLVYDGGAVCARKKVEMAQTNVDKNQLSVRLYDINSRVDELFFSILMIDEQLKQMKIMQNDLDLSLSTVQAMMNGGVANQSDIDNVKVEQLRAIQQEGSLRTSRKTYARMLGLFIGKDVDQNTHLVKPTTAIPSMGDATQRPEMSYYLAQQQLLDTQRKALDTKLIPTLSAFVMAMYHNKVMDMMNPGMVAGGITLTWKISPFYTRKNDLRSLGIKKQIVDKERETFLFNMRIQNEAAIGGIDDLRQKIKQDDSIIQLRENIHRIAMTKVQNGIETVNEMLRDVNAVSEARQQKSIHEIQLLQAIYQLKHINNN